MPPIGELGDDPTDQGVVRNSGELAEAIFRESAARSPLAHGAQEKSRAEQRDARGYPRADESKPGGGAEGADVEKNVRGNVRSRPKRGRGAGTASQPTVEKVREREE